MPELPEVETIRRGLEKHLLSKSITNIEIRFPKLFSGDPDEILNKEVVGVRRFGKGLVIDFSNGLSLVVHVKMTGQFVYVGETVLNLHPKLTVGPELPNKWTHIIFIVKDKNGGLGTLFYNDIRKFGWLKIVKTDQVYELSFFKSLGKELPVIKTEDVLSKKEFAAMLKASSSPIKSLIMDQLKIAGVGNIYANEALFITKIHPLKKANTLSVKQVNILFDALVEVMQKGLEHGGASEINYINVDGTKGEFQNHFQIYGKGGQKCVICGQIIQRIVVGGRGTFFCPECQR